MKTLAKWTIKDYHQMIAAGILENRSVELLLGEIVEMPPEGPLHTFYGEDLAEYLRSCLIGRALVREARPITLEDSEPEPDISVVRAPRENYREHHPYAEDIFLVVEVSNTSLTKDLEVKKLLYASAGIPEYWIIDLKNKQLIVFRSPEGNDYSCKQEMNQGKIVLVAFPDVELRIDRLLA